MFHADRLSQIWFWVLLPLLKRHFSLWVKFNWNASNRIKDFWSAPRLPFQSKHYAQGELCYCSTPFIHQWVILASTPFHPASHQCTSLLQNDNFCHCTNICPVKCMLAWRWRKKNSTFVLSCFKILPNYITLKCWTQPPHIVCEEVALTGCAVKLNVTGGMAGSWTLISFTKTFTLQRTKTHSRFCGEEREEEAGTRLMVTAQPGTVLSRNSHGSELLEKKRF